MKLGTFLKQYLKQSLQAFKHPKQLLPTIILTVVWIILGILQIKLKENLPMKVLNFITYAQGGLYGGVASAIGGILGKVLVAGFVNALIVPLFMGKKPFNGMGNGFKELGKSLSLQGRKALAPLLKGFGAALILYGLSNTGGRFENSMAGIMAAVSLALAMGKKNGFLWNFACSYAQSVSKGKTPDYHSILRALTGMTLGFTLGVGMHAAGIGMVGLLGVAFLLLGWILGWGTKKEAIVAMALIALTLMPAPEAQAAKKKKNFKGAWVLVEVKDQMDEEEKTYTLSDGVSYTVPVPGGWNAAYGRFEMRSKENRSFLDLRCNNVGSEKAFFYPGQSYSSGASTQADDNNVVSMSATLENYVSGTTKSSFKQPKKGADGNFTFIFPTEQEIGTRNWSYVIKWTLDGTEAYLLREYVFEWTEIEIGNWVLKDQKVKIPNSVVWSNEPDNFRVKINNISYDAKTGDYSYEETTESKSTRMGPGSTFDPQTNTITNPIVEWITSNQRFTGTVPIMEGPYKAGEEYLFPNERLTNERKSISLNNMGDYTNNYLFVININGERKVGDRLWWRDYGRSGYTVRFPTHDSVDGDVLEVECLLVLPGDEISHTYIFSWDGRELDEDEKASLADGGDGEDMGDYGGDWSPADLIEWFQKKLDNEKHCDEVQTILRDLIAGLTAALVAGGAAGAAGGGAGGLFGGEGPDGSKSEEEKDWERQMEEYKKWEKSKFDKYTRKNPDGTITVTDPSTGKSSVWYPKEGGGYENENGTPYSDNDLANWLDERERNSDYNRQNAETTEKNLEEWRKRNEELKDMDRETYEEKKKAREEQYKLEDKIRRLADKFHTEDDLVKVKEALAKEMEEAKAESQRARANVVFWDKVVTRGEIAQAACDGFISIGAAVTGPVGKAIQATYIVGKSTLGRTSEALMAKKQGLRGAVAGGLKGLGVGVLEAATNLIPVKTDSLTGAAVTSFTKSFGTTLTTILNGRIDGKSKEEVNKDVIDASAMQLLSTLTGAAWGKTKLGRISTNYFTPKEYKYTVLTLGGKDLVSTDFSGTLGDYFTAQFDYVVVNAKILINRNSCELVDNQE